MRTFAIAAAIVIVAAGAAFAQPTRRAAAPAAAPATAEAPTPLPRLLADAGYAHPDITAAMCEHVSAKESRCTIPGMTAGPYLIVASGTSTAVGDGAVQAIDIQINNSECTRGQSNNTAKGAKPWTSGPQTIRVGCAVQVLTDQPLVVKVTYDSKNATPDPKGPGLGFRRLAWSGVLQAAAAGGEEDQPKPAAQ